MDDLVCSNRNDYFFIKRYFPVENFFKEIFF